MESVIHQQVLSAFHDHVDFLRGEAEQNRIFGGLKKAIGLTSMVLGGFSLVTVPGFALIPLLGGAAGYLGTVTGQARRTGRIMLFPFLEVGLESLLGKVAKESLPVEVDLSDYQYMSAKQKAEYALILNCGDRIALALAQLPTDNHRAFVWESCLRRFQEAYLPHIKESPELLMRVDGSELADFVLAGEDEMRSLRQAIGSVGSETHETVGENTQLKAIPVRAEDVPTPPEPIEAIEVPEHLGQLFANRDINPQFLAQPVEYRAAYLLKALTQDGLDINRYLSRPTFGAAGGQRSGKTTLIMLMAILEKALYGRDIYYITRDDDVYPIAFSGVVSGSETAALAGYRLLIERIAKAGMHGLKNQCWVLDELSRVARQLGDAEADQLWSLTLTGFAKLSGYARIILHGKTAKANGVPDGWAETFKNEVAIAWTERNEQAGVGYLPSGKYEVLRGEGNSYRATGETFSIPEWLLFDVNPHWNNAPCPVRSLLRFFPEFDTRQQGAKPPSLITQHQPPRIQVVPLSESLGQGPKVVAEVYEAQEFSSISPVTLADLNIEPIHETYPTIPGTPYTTRDAIERIAKYMARYPDKSFLARSLDQAFTSGHRAALRPYLSGLARSLVEFYPTEYSSQLDGANKRRFVYQGGIHA
ncbi:MAG: ATP-binding protein [Cyanobacteria bacterium P01_G01_bin.38]